jgi:hypothetical protein
VLLIGAIEPNRDRRNGAGTLNVSVDVFPFLGMESESFSLSTVNIKKGEEQ